MNSPAIHKAGLLIVREGRILLCRKAHTTALLILPGGRIEPGESHKECLLREISEELGDVRVEQLEFVGTYTDAAAGADPTKTVQIELYSGRLDGHPEARSEIRELIWFGENDDWATLAPSLANKILPDLIQRGLLVWPSRQAGAT